MKQFIPHSLRLALACMPGLFKCRFLVPLAVILAYCLGGIGLLKAELHDRGGGLLYDDVMNVTWLQDANYAKTSGRSPTGMLSWQDANKWVSNLVYHDSVRNVDLKGWRLPMIKPQGKEYVYEWKFDGLTDEGYNITSTRSELSYMYYKNLQLIGWWTPDGKHPKQGFGVMGDITAIWSGQRDVGLVKNLQSNGYWSASLEPNHPWVFVMSEGNQRDGFPYPNSRYVWPVRDGDVAAPGTAAGATPAAAPSKGVKANQEGIDTVIGIPGLVAFWTFDEESGQPRLSKGTTDKFPMVEVCGPMPREEGGPYSGYSLKFDGKHYLRVPRADMKGLDIKGKDAQVTMFAVVRLSELNNGMTIAGVWSEGNGPNDDTGTRQYSMLLNMPTYGGTRQLTPHISSEGGFSRRADGTGLPWCADFAANRTEIPIGQWVTLGFTYDGKYIRAYYNGVMEERAMDPVKDKRTDPYFTKEGPNGGPRGMNPYYHGRGIFVYDPAVHAKTKPAGPPDFTVGARYAGGFLREALKGDFGALVVYNRALSDEEMKRLHNSAKIESLK